MRLSLVAGVLLIVGGVVVMARGFAYTSQRSVLKVGDFLWRGILDDKLRTRQRSSLPRERAFR